MAVDTVAEPEAARPTPRRPLLDRRTLLICAAIALVAAILSGVVVAAVTDHHDSTPTGLSAAKSVPAHVPFTRFDGTKGTLGAYAGQKLVVNFFASTCVPCRTEMPNLEKVQRAAGDEFTVVGIAVEDQASAAQALVKAAGVHYDVGQDLTGTLFQQAGGTVLPYTIFVAADGTIMQRHSGALSLAQLHSAISSNLLAGG